MKKRIYFSLIFFGVACGLVFYTLIILPLFHPYVRYVIFLFEYNRPMLYIVPLFGLLFSWIGLFKKQKRNFLWISDTISLFYIILMLGVVIWTYYNYDKIILKDICVKELKLKFTDNYPICYDSSNNMIKFSLSNVGIVIVNDISVGLKYNESDGYVDTLPQGLSPGETKEYKINPLEPRVPIEIFITPATPKNFIEPYSYMCSSKQINSVVTACK